MEDGGERVEDRFRQRPTFNVPTFNVPTHTVPTHTVRSNSRWLGMYQKKNEPDDSSCLCTR